MVGGPSSMQNLLMEWNPGSQAELSCGSLKGASLGICDPGEGKEEQSQKSEFISLISSGILSISMPVSSI